MPKNNLPAGFTVCPYHDRAHLAGKGCLECDISDAMARLDVDADSDDTTLHPAPARPALADYTAFKAAAVNDAVDAPAVTLDRLSEAVIQAQCEQWLEYRGYWRRSRKNLAAAPPPRGWQYHLHACDENPPLLDLLIMSLNNRCLELELKTATGKATKEQLAILNGRDVQRSLLEVQRVVEQWEQVGERRPN